MTLVEECWRHPHLDGWIRSAKSVVCCIWNVWLCSFWVMGEAPQPWFCRQVELLVDALYDSDAKVQKGAIQSYLHWLAAPSRLSDVVIQDEEWERWLLLKLSVMICTLLLTLKCSMQHKDLKNAKSQNFRTSSSFPKKNKLFCPRESPSTGSPIARRSPPGGRSSSRCPRGPTSDMAWCCSCQRCSTWRASWKSSCPSWCLGPTWSGVHGGSMKSIKGWFRMENPKIGWWFQWFQWFQV